MIDPYKVLGVEKNATEDEIKKAYRELARKYHPDNYHENPLADLASEKMKEINEAYDMITKPGGNAGSAYGGTGGGYGNAGGANAYGGAGGGYNAGGAASNEFRAVREAINLGRLDYAEDVLAQAANRSGEWHFLMGSICFRRGWLAEASQYFEIAVTMEPNNSEYRAALMQMRTSGGGFRTNGYGGVSRQNDCDTCDICSALLCMNMCCNCR